MSSRLFQAIREDKALAYEIKSGYSKFSDAGLLTISAGVAEDKIYETLKCVMSVIAGLQKNAVPAPEFQRAKNYCRGALRLHLEGTVNQMMWQGESVVAQGELRNTKNILSRIDAITTGEIMQAAKTLFAPGRMHLAVISSKCHEDKLRTILKENI